jgi:hypothetical protein
VRKHFMSTTFEHKTAKDLVNEYKEISGENITEEEAESVRKNIIDKKFNLKYPNAYFLKFALTSIEMHAQIFFDMNMVILRSNNKRHFITSDNPVVYFVPREKVTFYDNYKSLMSQHTEVFFPVTRNIAIVFSRKELGKTIQPTNREMVDIINYNISVNSFNFIFSPVKMNDLNKFIKEYIPYPFEFRMS